MGVGGIRGREGIQQMLGSGGSAEALKSFKTGIGAHGSQCQQKNKSEKNFPFCDVFITDELIPRVTQKT